MKKLKYFLLTALLISFSSSTFAGDKVDVLATVKSNIEAFNKQDFKTYFSNPDLKLTFSEEFYGDNKYAGHWSFTVTNTGPGEIPPTGKSVLQLNRKLRALIDQPAGQLIRSMRLNCAAYLLKQNAGLVAEICYLVGFNDQSYFTRAFKKQFVVTPTEYKKQM